MMVTKILITLLILAFIIIVIIAYACVSLSSRLNRVEEKPRGSDVALKNEFFCLAMNRPIKYLDYKDMPGCTPGKCQTCRLAVFRDL